GDAEILEVVELLREPCEVADAISVRIVEAALEQVIEHLFAGRGGRSVLRLRFRRRGSGLLRRIGAAARQSDRQRKQRGPGGGVHAFSRVDGVWPSAAPKKRSVSSRWRDQ